MTRPIRQPLLRASAACLALLLPTAAARAQGEILALDVPAGTVIAFEDVTQFALDMQMTFAGQQMDADQRLTSTVAGTGEVLEVGPDGAPTAVRVTFDPGLTVDASSMGAQTSEPFPLAGQTVTLTRTASGIAVDPDPGLDEDTRAGLASYLDFSRGLLPDRPVAPGDTWQGDPDMMAQDASGLDPQVTFTLERFAERDGRRVAETRIDLSLAGAFEGARMDGTGQGTVVFDLATGLVVDGTADMDFTLGGTAEEGGVEVQFGGGGTLSTRSSAVPTGGGMAAATGTRPADETTPGVATAEPSTDAGAAVGEAAAAPQAGAAQADRSTPNRAQNVRPETAEAGLAQGAQPATGQDAGAPAGQQPRGEEAYANGDLTVTPRGGEVTIERGGDSYSGRILSRDDGRIEGEFTAAGTTFPFTATIDGATMTLESGGTTYDLARTETPANPLGGN